MSKILFLLAVLLGAAPAWGDNSAVLNGTMTGDPNGNVILNGSLIVDQNKAQIGDEVTVKGEVTELVTAAPNIQVKFLTYDGYHALWIARDFIISVIPRALKVGDVVFDKEVYIADRNGDRVRFVIQALYGDWVWVSNIDNTPMTFKRDQLERMLPKQ